MIKQAFTLFLAVIPLAAISQTNTPPRKGGAEVMRELRNKALTTPASALAISPTKEYPRVFAVLMDFPVGTNTATVVSLCTGDASLYTTSSFGIIGGTAHDTVRAAAQKFVRAAEAHCDEAGPTKEYPYPKPDRVYFYLVCFDGVRTIDADGQSLLKPDSKYSDLFLAGQRVIGELRKISQQRPAGSPHP